MGPSVKFVLPIIDAFPNKKMWVIFGVAKKDTTGGGSEGVAFFGRNFSRLSFLNNSLSKFPLYFLGPVKLKILCPILMELNCCGPQSNYLQPAQQKPCLGSDPHH